MPPKRGSEPPSDDVVRRAQRGDPEAQRLLYEHYIPLLRARIQRRLPSLVRRKVAASDVIQEAWLTAFQRLPSFEFRSEGTFEAWLARIVENKVRDEVRRFLRTGKRDARREGPDAATAGVRGKTRSPSSVVSGNEEREAVEERLRRLPARYRLVVDLVHREGLSWADVGERMGCSAEAARKLYARVIGRLGEGGTGGPAKPRKPRTPRQPRKPRKTP
jgi:RNA polymerase sigma-70 factor (ECF subfamily)